MFYKKNKIDQVYIYENAYSEIKNKWYLLRNDWFYTNVSGTWSKNYLKNIYETSSIYSHLFPILGDKAILCLRKNNFTLDHNDNLSHNFLCHSYNKLLYGRIVINLKSSIGILCNCYFTKKLYDFFSIVYSEENWIVSTPEELVDFISFFLKYDMSKIITPSKYFGKAVTNIRYWAANDLQKRWI